jgi:hypothetical protein
MHSIQAIIFNLESRKLSMADGRPRKGSGSGMQSY